MDNSGEPLERIFTEKPGGVLTPGFNDSRIFFFLEKSCRVDTPKPEKQWGHWNGKTKLPTQRILLELKASFMCDIVIRFAVAMKIDIHVHRFWKNLIWSCCFNGKDWDLLNLSTCAFSVFKSYHGDVKVLRQAVHT